MNNRMSSLSFISDRTIGTKVAAGFAVVLLILAVSSVLAWLAFGRASGAVDDYARLVANSAIFRDIDLTVTRYRGHVREYVFSNDEATAATAVKDGEALRQLIASGLAKVTNPERHRLLEDAAKQADTYAANFERIRAMNLEQGKLEADVLDPVGQQMTDGFTAIITGANKAGIADLLPLAIEGRRLSLMARLDVNKRLGRHDEAAAKSAAQTFEDAAAHAGADRLRDQGHGCERSGSSRDETDRYLSGSLHACRQSGHRSDRTGERRHEAGG